METFILDDFRDKTVLVIEEYLQCYLPFGPDAINLDQYQEDSDEFGYL